MSDIFLSEIQDIQNPALGAVLMHSFALGYEEQSTTSAPVPMLLTFLVLPVLLHEETHSYIQSTQARSGLRKVISKMIDEKKGDLVMSIHSRTVSMKRVSLNSLRIALSKNLLHCQAEEGFLSATDIDIPPSYTVASVQELIKSASKLGKWFSQLSLSEISLILQVSF